MNEKLIELFGAIEVAYKTIKRERNYFEERLNTDHFMTSTERMACNDGVVALNRKMVELEVAREALAQTELDATFKAPSDTAMMKFRASLKAFNSAMADAASALAAVQAAADFVHVFNNIS